MTTVLTSVINREIYLIINQSIIVWSLQKGVLVRKFDQIAKDKITSGCLGSGDKFLIMGIITGEIM